MATLSVRRVYPSPRSQVRNGVLLSALCLVAALGQSTDPASTGCFRDARSDRVLRAMMTSDDMTPTACKSHCSDAEDDYAFYATQFGKECWCGEAGIDYDRHGPGTCDFACSGDSSLYCGGYLAFTLYEMEPGGPMTDPDSIGCLRDDRSDRVLTEMMTNDEMTPAVCKSHCSDAEDDYAFYATQFGKECWCGRAGIDYDRHGPGTCDFACSGDPYLYCGGYLAFTLYEMEPGGPMTDPDSIGCLRDDRSDRVLTEMMTSDEMTPALCGSHCSDAEEDYAFYATQFGKECWCGRAGIDYDRHGPGTCDFACSGDPSLFCGGYLAFTLYESDAEPPEDPDCILEVLDINTVVTEIGGATVTVASNCEIGTTISFDDGSSGPILLAGEALVPLPDVDVGSQPIASAVKFVTPPFVLDMTHGVHVHATLDEGGVIMTNIPVSSFSETIEIPPSVSIGGLGGGSVRAVITDPPTDLELSWDPDLLRSDTVDIEVIMVGREDGDLESAGFLATGVSNGGSYVVEASVLLSFDVPEETLVIIKIVSSGSGRRLQDEEPLAFPEVITSTLIEWIASPPSDVSVCGDLFADADSRCQCFFSIERARGGVPVTSFGSAYRCPATINCALGMPERSYIRGSIFRGWVSDTLQSEWGNDLACSFSRCTWPNDGRWPEDESAGAPTALDLGEPTCSSWSLLPFMCEFHPGAAFCIRTSEAEDPSGNPIVPANQCCYDEAGNLLTDIAAGGGTIDRVAGSLSTFFGHRAADVIPFDWCCGSGLDSWQCRMYSEMRPTDAGDGHPTCTAKNPSDAILTKTVTISVTLPEFPADIDFGLLVDASGSYGDDIDTIKSLAPNLIDDLLDNGEGGERENLRLALGSFSDIPESPFGSAGDYAYRQDKAFVSCGGAPDPEACKEADRDSWIGAVDSLEAMGGADFSESQSIALYRACTDWDWGDGITKILAITTDATFHTPDDDPRYFSLNQIIDQCNANNVKILALKAPGAGDEMDTLADATGGSVQPTDAASSEIVEAILEGIADSSFNVVEVQWACRDTFGDAAWQREDSGAMTDIEGGTEVEFTLTVSVPDNLEAGVKCVALVVADEILVGGHEFEVTPGGIIDADINP